MEAIGWTHLAAAAAGYLLGSIPFGLILTKLGGMGDIRAMGSGNIGATNVLRTGNKALAALTLFLDGGKGALAVLAFASWGRDAALVAAADHFASDQIRNAATIGGNICNASPAGDTIVPLLLLDAEVELACWQGSVSLRKVALSDFFTGPGATVKASNELLTAVSFAQPAAGSVARFTKSGPRPALEISTVSAGISGVWANGALSGVRVALGAVAPTPLRARATEAFLEGKPLDDETVAGAAETALSDCAPIDDVRASAWYRNHLVQVYIERMLQDVCNS